MKKLNVYLKSVRIKLFLTLCIVVLIIISFLIITNNFVLETFYFYNKERSIFEVYHKINDYYINNKDIDLELELQRDAVNNNFDIVIKTDENIIVYSTDSDFFANTIKEYPYGLIRKENEKENEKSKINITKIDDTKSGLTFIMFRAQMDNGYMVYIRMPIASIHESVKISNKFLYLIGGITILIGGVVVSFISRKFTHPIVELNNIAKKMSNLDFSHKYRITDTEDEINDLGKSINTMSDKLERTIRQLRSTNIELEKDIEEKSKIDEMRKQFISDVSHELKTPIALIQGYAEGLIENVNTDEENRRFYSEVILDEANKMDKLVKQLLELMKLEYGKREFDNKPFCICELIREVIRKNILIIEQNNIKIQNMCTDSVYVYADEFYIEQVLTNYLTNAIKHVKQRDNVKEIIISTNINIEKNKIRISVFNTGDNIKEENLQRIWNRFYKVDESRNRQDGGTGIGLSLVKAIMNNYELDYGVINKENGVEFYFDLELDKL